MARMETGCMLPDASLDGTLASVPNEPTGRFDLSQFWLRRGRRVVSDVIRNGDGGSDAVAAVGRHLNDFAHGLKQYQRPDAATVHQLARLLNDARKACDQEAVVPTEQEFYARVCSRLGLNARLSADAAPWPARRAVPRALALADEVLGERERIVFKALVLSPGARPADIEALAQTLGVSVIRLRELEYSARRKIDAALTPRMDKAPS